MSFAAHNGDRLHSAPSSGPSSPSTRSPAKSRPRRDSPARPQPATDMEVSGPPSISTNLRGQVEGVVEGDPIAAFPTSNSPISDTVLKEMLLSLRSSLQSDMVADINKCTKEFQAPRLRVDHVESKMEEYTSSYNVMVEAHTAQGEDLAWMRDKIADLEDRSRRNYIQIRGIPESIAPDLLLQDAQTLFSTLIPSLSAQDLIVDRIHRIPKPSFLPAETSRDVLL